MVHVSLDTKRHKANINVMFVNPKQVCAIYPGSLGNPHKVVTTNNQVIYFNGDEQLIKIQRLGSLFTVQVQIKNKEDDVFISPLNVVSIQGVFSKSFKITSTLTMLGGHKVNVKNGPDSIKSLIDLFYPRERI